MPGVRYPVSLLTEEAGQRRSPDERLFVRFPGLYRLLADRVTRLPLGSRLRRWFLTRSVVRGCAAANRRDFDLLLTAFDPGIEYRSRLTARAWRADLDEVYHGHAGYRKAWRQLLDAFGDARLEPQEVLDLGDRLVSAVKLRGHGSGSGVPVDLQLFQLFGLRRGLVVWQRDFDDRSEALEAAARRE